MGTHWLTAGVLLAVAAAITGCSSLPKDPAERLRYDMGETHLATPAFGFVGQDTSGSSGAASRDSAEAGRAFGELLVAIIDLGARALVEAAKK